MTAVSKIVGPLLLALVLLAVPLTVELATETVGFSVQPTVACGQEQEPPDPDDCAFQHPQALCGRWNQTYYFYRPLKCHGPSCATVTD